MQIGEQKLGVHRIHNAGSGIQCQLEPSPEGATAVVKALVDIKPGCWPRVWEAEFFFRSTKYFSILRNSIEDKMAEISPAIAAAIPASVSFRLISSISRPCRRLRPRRRAFERL